jgi:hypothetical protein
MTVGRIFPIVLAVLGGVFILWFFASCASLFSDNSSRRRSRSSALPSRDDDAQ